MHEFIIHLLFFLWFYLIQASKIYSNLIYLFWFTDIGCLFVWGENDNGKLGLAKYQFSHFRQPQIVETNEKVRMASAGNSHSVILTGKSLFTSENKLQGIVVTEKALRRPNWKASECWIN